MNNPLPDSSLDTIFREARTQNGWLDGEVGGSVIRELYDLLRMGPTSANCSPARFLFVASQAGKERLRPALSGGNLEKTMAAPVTVIVGYDTRFYKHLPALFPHAPAARDWFTSSPALAEETAFRNSALQGAYLIIAARALGLDAGPMSGFDPKLVNEAFWPDGRVKVNFLCNIGHGDPSKLFGRNPRLSFEEACSIV